MNIKEVKHQHEVLKDKGLRLSYVHTGWLIEQVEELRKALEEIADFNNPTGEDGREMVEIARSALGKEQTS